MGMTNPAAWIASPTLSMYASSRFTKKPSNISRPSASRSRAMAIQSKTVIDWCEQIGSM